MKLPLLLAVGCISLASLINSQAATIQVSVGAGGLKFTPANVTINVGDTVQWNWVGSGHSSTSGTPGHPSGLFDSGVQNSGFVFTHTFTSAGAFPYYCTPHGSCCGMVGSVMVNAAADTVTITRAQYNSSRSQLVVNATDSDSSAVLTASITSSGVVLGKLRGSDGNYTGKFTVTPNPVNITVKSNLGGTATAAVRGR